MEVEIFDDVMTEVEARAVTIAISEHLEALAPLVKDAYRRRAWAALGYEDWDTYCKAEFVSLFGLPKVKRLELVCGMRRAGMSTRAIASATGKSKSQVDRDFDQLSQNGTVGLPDRVTGLDGKDRPAKQTVPVQGEVVDDEDLDSMVAVWDRENREGLDLTIDVTFRGMARKFREAYPIETISYLATDEDLVSWTRKVQQGQKFCEETLSILDTIAQRRNK